jgi:hypothetical protein
MQMDKNKATDATHTPIICVCMCCNRVRDSLGNWTLKAEPPPPNFHISHGLCPECEKKLYQNVGLMSRSQAF